MLKNSIVNAYKWATLAKIVNQSFSWIITIVLARLLTPADYGLIALAMIFIGFLDLMGTLGTGSAIIQKKEIDDLSLYSVFWISMALSFLYCFLTILAAPFTARFFNSPEVENVMSVLSINFIFMALRTVPYNMLTKKLQFDKRSLAEMIAVFLSGVSSLLLALNGFGVYSLVYGTLIKSLVIVIMVFWFYPWLPKMKFSYTKSLEMMSFGLKLVGSWILKFISERSTVVIIGKMLNEKSLGYYSMAGHIAMMPVEKLTMIINQVSFPVLSALQDDKEAMKYHVLKLARFVSVISFPMMVGLALVGKEMITVVLSDKWLPILIPLQLLCFVGLFRSIAEIFKLIFIAIGKPEINLRFDVIRVLLFPLSIYLVSGYGINGIALVILILSPLVYTYIFYALKKEINLYYSVVLLNIVPAGTCTLIMFIAVMIFQKTSSMYFPANDIFLLVSIATTGMVVYITSFFIFFKKDFKEVLDMGKKISKG
jgi:O-antigen/teichoic acid export membrane protein